MLPKRSTPSRPQQTVRIIGGSLRGSRLPVPMVEGLRPTPDRVRETLFNWLRPGLPGARVLDLFAGSGALGLEALSQGARQVEFVEAHPATAQSLLQQVARLGMSRQASVRTATAPAVLAQVQGAFDLILLDPPYALNLWDPCLRGIHERALLSAGGLIYLEWPQGSPEPTHSTFSWHKQSRAGAVNFGLLQQIEGHS